METLFKQIKSNSIRYDCFKPKIDDGEINLCIVFLGMVAKCGTVPISTAMQALEGYEPDRWINCAGGCSRSLILISVQDDLRGADVLHYKNELHSIGSVDAWKKF